MDLAISEGEKSPKENSLTSNGGQKDVEAGDDQLHRGLRSYHLQFIAIGGTVGTGLFLGSGEALATAGPVGCLIAFLFVGSIVFSIMTSLGEMASFIPVAGSFTVYASRFVDRSLGFAMGWIYWFSWSITFALELVAAGVIIQYWDSTLSIGIFIAIFWVIFTGANFLPIRYFGAFEMWFSSIKVVTIVGFIIFAICIDAGAGKNGYLGFDAWVHPGPFAEYIFTGNIGKFVDSGRYSLPPDSATRGQNLSASAQERLMTQQRMSQRLSGGHSGEFYLFSFQPSSLSAYSCLMIRELF